MIYNIPITIVTFSNIFRSSPDARNWLQTNAPLANDFVALVYQENTTYWKFTTNQLSKASSSIRDFLFGKVCINFVFFYMSIVYHPIRE